MTAYEKIKIEPMCEMENENYAIATENIKKEPPENFVFVEVDLSCGAVKQEMQTETNCSDNNQVQEYGVEISDVILQRELSNRRVSYGQLEQLWEVLNKNRGLALGFNKSSQARELSRQMWKNIAENLNSNTNGAVKDWRGWCKYWNDYKWKLKKLAAQHMTVGGAQVRSMSDIEKQFLSMFSDFDSGLPGVSQERGVEIESNDRAASSSTAPLPSTAALPSKAPIPSTTPLPSTAPLPSTTPLPSTALPSTNATPSTASLPSTASTSSTPPLPSGTEEVTVEQQPTSAVGQIQRPRRTPRHRWRRESPMGQEAALRSLIRASERRLEIEERNCDTLVNLLQEIRDIRLILQSRSARRLIVEE